MTIQEWLGNNELGVNIWNSKYCFENETFDEWLSRVSGYDKEVENLIKEKKFLFGGRILSNRGLEKKGKKITLSNCYVITPPSDSIESIFDCASKLARTYSYGGGCGIDLSNLAPKGSRVNNAAKETTGAVSFMDLYSMITGLIGQNGRRGALMLSMSCDHPDIEEFINIKSDLNKVTKANISIKITSDFMNAVKEKKNFTLSFTRQETKETIIKQVNAYDLFKHICKMNWDYAEPGMLFWDEIENWNLLSCDDNFHYAGTNPCFSGDMNLLTVDGYKKFEDLCDTEPYIYNVNGNIVKSKVWCSGIKKTVKVKIGKGQIICTPDHRFMTIDGDECMAKDLKGKYLMPCTNVNKKFNERFIKYGFIQGDGQLKRLDSQYHEGIEVNIGHKDTDIYELFSNEKFTVKSEKAIYVDGFKEDLIKLGFSHENLPYRIFPSTYDKWSKLEKASFLHGCYSANGSVIKNGRISYKTTCKKFAEQLKNTLLNDFDIQGVYITTNKSHKVKFSNGEYVCKESYDVNIGQYIEITKFISEINFYQQYKREQLTLMLKSRPAYVYNVEDGDEVKVYDFKEPERHWGVVEGYIVHNCAEEPLPAGGSCLLGSINLSEFVLNPFTNNAKFDFDMFKKTVAIAVRALNKVLDEGLPLHPLKEQRDSVRDWRQIGLGIMGLSDMLIKMGITYGETRSINLCDKIGFTMADTAISTSALLAKEESAYPKYNQKVLESKYFKYNTSDDTRNLVKKYGLRNSQLLTIAPTGTLSTMLGISGGIEPIYANFYERKTESLHGTDVYYKVYTPIVEKYMKDFNISDDSKLPTFFVTAMTLDYTKRINMQAVWQKHIDASISSTVNVPNSFTIEDTMDLYMKAWKNNLKGITIYRDGCKRSGILSTTTDTKNNKISKPTSNKTTTLERGMILKADDNVIGLKRTLTTGCGTLHCIALFDPSTGNMLETYFSKGSTGGCHNFMVGLSRIISLALRGGIDIHSIVDQLNSTGSCPSYAIRSATKHDTSKGSCCPMAIGNALLDMHNEFQKEYGTDGEYEIANEAIEKKDAPKKILPQKNITVKSELCPQCGEPLAFEGGCNICKSCGWSKCS